MKKLLRILVVSALCWFGVQSIACADGLALDLMPDKASRLANVAVEVVKQANGITLDYSPESLKIIDQLVLGYRKEGQTAAAMNKTLVTLGCYVGEVMVKHLGYRWDNPTATEMAFGIDVTSIRGTNGGLSNPIGKVFKLMKNGEEDSVVLFYKAFSKDLGKALKR